MIDIDIDVLCANTWIGTKSGKLNILSLTADGLQIALPDGDYGYSLNYYSQAKGRCRCAGSCIAQYRRFIMGRKLGCTACSHFTRRLGWTAHVCFRGKLVPMLWCLRLTLPVWRSAIPICLYALTTSSWTVLPSGFDANRFYYGDIEGNGKYRVQLFNAYGAGSVGNAVPLSPFSNVENQRY